MSVFDSVSRKKFGQSFGVPGIGFGVAQRRCNRVNAFVQKKMTTVVGARLIHQPETIEIAVAVFKWRN